MVCCLEAVASPACTGEKMPQGHELQETEIMGDHPKNLAATGSCERHGVVNETPSLSQFFHLEKLHPHLK